MSKNERCNWIANHEARKQDYVNLQTFIRVIKASLNKAIPEQYRPGRAISQRTFGNMSIRNIFDYLYNTYGTITETDKHNNRVKMQELWNINDHIEAMFQNIERCQLFAIRAREAFPTKHLISIATFNIQKTLAFKDELKEWTRQFTPGTNPEPTWIQFKKIGEINTLNMKGIGRPWQRLVAQHITQQ